MERKRKYYRVKIQRIPPWSYEMIVGNYGKRCVRDRKERKQSDDGK